MSIHKSYFNKNNTIISNSNTNTGLNPVTELFFGRADNVLSTPGYSRFIFDIDLSLLTQKINDGTISTGCTSAMTHTLNMTNTSYFDKDFLIRRFVPLSKDEFDKNKVYKEAEAKEAEKAKKKEGKEGEEGGSFTL